MYKCSVCGEELGNMKFDNHMVMFGWKIGIVKADF